MKLYSIVVFFTLINIVKGAWWAAAVQPVILGFGAILTALNQDALEAESFNFKLKTFMNKQDEVPEDQE